MTVRKTKSGRVIEVTNMLHGCLEQGGVSGREVLYSRAALATAGIDYDADPQGDHCEGISRESWLRNCCEPDRVLKAGHEIF